MTKRIQRTVRLPVDLDQQLVEAAAERGLSANDLHTRAVTAYLDRLIPLDKWKRTLLDPSGNKRDDSSSSS